MIGYVGCTGNCTGPHLHFETRVNGQAQDPRTYLSGGSIPGKRATVAGTSSSGDRDQLDGDEPRRSRPTADDGGGGATAEVAQARPAAGRRRPRPRRAQAAEAEAAAGRARRGRRRSRSPSRPQVGGAGRGRGRAGRRRTPAAVPVEVAAEPVAVEAMPRRSRSPPSRSPSRPPVAAPVDGRGRRRSPVEAAGGRAGRGRAEPPVRRPLEPQVERSGRRAATAARSSARPRAQGPLARWAGGAKGEPWRPRSYRAGSSRSAVDQLARARYW